MKYCNKDFEYHNLSKLQQFSSSLRHAYLLIKEHHH